ncbi:GNAT family N-acetyltransferase [Rhizobium sp. CSW-27]|uniref:GNAT family N-acetyltransferase n=1 Tax=Rhizobium sp. CSW-27 TaxID=2839985 RepID=UPI001C00E85B|nr:GNAT family N-acetyltransferase [Rhizobium sp. CSW-27]MBT9368760.1 GNAT family N-acetyltransferase [Rhizobium sp. CSW-27]
MVGMRELARHEIRSIWTIDRSEIIEATYRLKDGVLVLTADPHDVRGWPGDLPAEKTPVFEAGHDRGDWFCGLFDGSRLVGIAILGHCLFGEASQFLQLKFFYVDKALRQMGLGKALFEAATREARNRGARRLYISATPTQNTVDFYLHRGCRLLETPDPVLFDEEPDDLHLDYALG